MNILHKIKHIGLLPRVIIAMIAGIGIGTISPAWGARLMATFNGIFSSYLGFLIPLIIVGFVTPSIIEIGNRAGRLLLATALLAYLATILSGLFSYMCGTALFPSLITQTLPLGAVENESTTLWFTLEINPLCSVTTALVLSFLIGICGGSLKSDIVGRGFKEFRDIVELSIRKSVIPILPIYIFGLFMNMTVDGQVAVMLRTFFSIILIIFGIHVAVLLIQYFIAAAFARKNPFKMLWTMMPAYFTALGTQSSAATIPVTLRQAIKMGVSEEIAGFVIPLCATIHLSGSTLKIVACALALMIMQGMPHDFSLFLGFICMLGVTMVAAPGIPGGAIMAALGVMSSILGFTEHQCALMIALYIAMDSFGTACNVTGDGALAAIIDRFFGKNERKNRKLVA